MVVWSIASWAERKKSCSIVCVWEWRAAGRNRVGPKTVARFFSVILFLSSFFDTLQHNNNAIMTM